MRKRTPAWQRAKLTTLESENALTRAGLHLDPGRWSDDDMRLAERVLENAGNVKKRRIIAQGGWE